MAVVERIVLVYLINVSIPVLVLLFLLNRRWFRRKKRVLLTWLSRRGLIDRDGEYTEPRDGF